MNRTPEYVTLLLLVVVLVLLLLLLLLLLLYSIFKCAFIFARYYKTSMNNYENHFIYSSYSNLKLKRNKECLSISL
jgi:hypothetical protein